MINKLFLTIGGLMILAAYSCNRLPAPVENDILAFQSAMAFVDSVYKGTPEYLDVQNDSIDAALTRWDIAQASLEQIQELAKGGVLYKNQHLRMLVYPRLVELAKSPTVEGANAKSLSIVNFPMDPEKDKHTNQLDWARAYIEFASHPAIKEYMLQDGRTGSEIFTRLQFLDKDAVKESGLIHHLIPMLDNEMSTELASMSGQYFDEASNPELGLRRDSIELVRTKALKLTQKARIEYEQLAKDGGSNSRANYAKGMEAYLSGPFAKGTLLNNQAPEVPFYWCSDGKTKSLAELKGKVIVIDFWATWCGPCVGSFPNVRKLQERYKDYPVAIVGVTAIQGYHFDRKNNKRIRLENEPEKEMAMMNDFMKDFEMTWLVAFSDEEFNPDFGVRGIPHVAIIDPEGKVRYNMLRPYEPPFHEAEKIDKLLKEAGLPYPPEAMEEGNWGAE